MSRSSFGGYRAVASVFMTGCAGSECVCCSFVFARFLGSTSVYEEHDWMRRKCSEYTDVGSRMCEGCRRVEKIST